MPQDGDILMFGIGRVERLANEIWQFVLKQNRQLYGIEERLGVLESRTEYRHKEDVDPRLKILEEHVTELRQEIKFLKARVHLLERPLVEIPPPDEGTA
jgi:hypothetical protein